MICICYIDICQVVNPDIFLYVSSEGIQTTRGPWLSIGQKIAKYSISVNLDTVIFQNDMFPDTSPGRQLVTRQLPTGVSHCQ